MTNRVNELDWPGTADKLINNGYEPKDIIDAWKKLEKIAGVSGTAPSELDF